MGPLKIRQSLNERYRGRRSTGSVAESGEVAVRMRQEGCQPCASHDKGSKGWCISLVCHHDQKNDVHSPVCVENAQPLSS